MRSPGGPWLARAAAVLAAAALATGAGPVPTASAEARSAFRAAPGAAPAARSYGPQGVQARSAFLFDSTANRVMWSRHPATRLPIGSVTKVMTAMIVLGKGQLNRKITIRPQHIAYAHAHHGSTADLRAGDRLTTAQLLYALLLPSGCDAAAALVQAYGPGTSAFVRAMNRMAARLGMRDTHYANFDGTPWPTPTAGYSTARDLVTLSRYAMKNPVFREIVNHGKHVLPAGPGHHRYVWRTTNMLLRYDPDVIGIKTGHTTAAGYCSLFAARAGGRELIGVVLNSSRTDQNARVDDAIKLLNWGFDH